MVTLTKGGKVALDNLVAKLLAEQKIPAFALGATTADKEIYFNGGGYKNANDPAKGEVNGDTVFWICSMTKMVAHIAGLQLIDKGKLSVETPVSNFFPQFLQTVIIADISDPKSSFKPAKNVVTVKHLLNYSSGLYYPVIGPHTAYSAPHDKEDPHAIFFEMLKGDYPGIPLKFEPGTDFVYGYSSDILGFIVEKITGMTLEKYFQENIFQPLGMKASFYLTPDLRNNFFELTKRTPSGYEVEQGFIIIEKNPEKVSRHMGGVGLYTSLRDYLTLLRHILQIHAGKATSPILSIESVRSMFTGTSTEAGTKSLDAFSSSAPTMGNSWSSALAVSSVDTPWGRKKGSAFWSGWAGTYFFMDPTTGVAAVYGTQLAMHAGVSGSRDPVNLEAFTAFEQTLYAGLSHGEAAERN